MTPAQRRRIGLIADTHGLPGPQALAFLGGRDLLIRIVMLGAAGFTVAVTAQAAAVEKNREIRVNI